MQKKTISFFFFGLLTALVLATSAVLYFVDWNQYRSELAQLVSERLGVRVEVAGDLGLQILPRPSLTARAIRLSPLQPEFDDTIATADRIDMRLGLAAALTGNIELQSLALDGVSIALEETAAGWRIKGWPASEENSDDPTQTEDGNETAALASLDRFRLENSKVTLTQLSGVTTTLGQINVDLSGTLPSGPVEWDGSVVVADTPLSISGRVVPVKTRDETSIRSVVKVAGASIEAAGRITPKGDITGRLQGEGKSVHSLAVFAAKLMDKNLPAKLPDIPFSLDMQVDRENGITRVVSRQFSIDKTRGVVDLTIAEKKEGFHLTGTTTLGVITLDENVFETTEAVAQPIQSSAQQSSKQNDEAISITGAIDITVEGVEYRNGLVQQITSVVGFEGGAPFLSQFSALLPGASRIAYATDGNDLSGRITFQSGRLPEMFKWMDIPISDAVPSGRLTTADISGNIVFSDSGWALSELKGTVDTSTITARMSGSTAPFSFDYASFNVDKLNLDAYWPDPTSTLSKPTDSGSAKNTLLPDTELDLSIGSLQWLRRSFTNINAKALLSGDSVSLRNFRIENEGGTLAGTVNIQGINNTSAFAEDMSGDISLTKWRYPIISKLLPENSKQIEAFANSEPISGTISFNGPASAVQTRIDIGTSAGKNKVDLTGTLDVRTPINFDIQGTISHENALAVLATLPNANAFKGELPVALNISSSGTVDDLSFRTSGLVAGHQLDASGNYSDAQSAVDFSLNMPSGISSHLQDIAGSYAQVFDVSAPSRVRFKAIYSEDSLALNDIDFSNGTMRTSGNISIIDSTLDGGLALTNVDVDRILNKLNLESNDSGTTYDGRVSLNLNNLTLFGQRLDAPESTINIQKQAMNVALGANAKLNGEPVTGIVNLADASPSNIQFNSATIDAGKLLAAMGVSKSFTGMITTNMDLSAQGDTAREMLAGLSGDVSFSGGAGSMYFMAVPKIIEALQSSDSKTSFLSTIGSLLRSGTTSFANFEGSLRFDGGVALIDQIVASGDWGKFSVGGQANIVDDILDLRGSLDLVRPQDTPAIPVVYKGSLTSPTTNWASGALERFALAGIQRRLRNELFGEFDKAQSGDGDTAPANPGSAVVGAAFGLLSKLREAQEAKKKESADMDKQVDEKPSADQNPD